MLFISKAIFYNFITAILVCLSCNSYGISFNSLRKSLYDKWYHIQLNRIVRNIDREASLFKSLDDNYIRETTVYYLHHIHTQKHLQKTLDYIGKTKNHIEYCKSNTKAIALKQIGLVTLNITILAIIGWIGNKIKEQNNPSNPTDDFSLLHAAGVLGAIAWITSGLYSTYYLFTRIWTAIGLPGSKERCLQRLNIIKEEIQKRRQSLELERTSSPSLVE